MSASYIVKESRSGGITIPATVGETLAVVFTNGHSGNYDDSAFYVEGATRLSHDGGIYISHLGYIRMKATSPTITISSLWGDGMQFVVVR